jgi:hypothetical protein
VAAYRWMEIDLYWFQQGDIARSVGEFGDRFTPLYHGVTGYKGVILNVGWTVGYVMEWDGDLRQRITLPKGAGQQRLDLAAEKPSDSSNQGARLKSFVYGSDGSPQLLLDREPQLNLMLWDPPDFLADPNRFDKPLPEDWGSSPTPYALTAASLNELLRAEGALHARSIDVDQTGTVGAWRTRDGTLHLLFGNLEEGLRNDADRSRHFTLEFPRDWTGLQWRSVWDPTTAPGLDHGTIQVDMKADSSILLEWGPH